MVTNRTAYLVPHNLQVDADGQPWSTIIINNLVDHGLRKLCQTLVNHGWLRCYVTNRWLTMLITVLIKLCQTMVMVDWGAISHTYGWPRFGKALLNYGQQWLTEVPFHTSMVDCGLGKLCQPWLSMVCAVNADSSNLSMVNHGYKHC